MTKLLTLVLTISLALAWPICARADRDGFNEAVKLIEQFYHVKHQNIPLLARASMKAVKTAAKIKGGEYKKLAEAGSVRVAFFEEQTFDSRGQIASFKSGVQSLLGDQWSALVQTLAPKTEEQTYVYVRDAGKNFHVLVITIERREATVIQATLAPQVLADLLKDPEGMGKAITDEATTSDP
ncbi:MAG TPA: hypothetical protein VHQ64_06480 [Pyrinomonadaceae bacterium]|jgi:hypothetical protein|nr:hypothetical protein [Pyrinomonadaceae bacterium]